MPDLHLLALHPGLSRKVYRGTGSTVVYYRPPTPERGLTLLIALPGELGAEEATEDNHEHEG